MRVSQKNDTQTHASHESAISMRDVAVRYRVPAEKIATLKEVALRILQGKPVEHKEFWALQGINLDVREGEALGIIGRNGAGKTTLLKVVSKILRPTKGRVIVRGRVAPLIALGAGFHPELTGRENIYLNGAVLGFSRLEMDERFDRIVEFSELEDFIDAPIRTYSSGMTMRLGFAIATDVDADILIIDEVLSVGDEAFQRKCQARMAEFIKSGTTLLFVSHSANQVKELCDRAIWIERGRISAKGPVDDVVQSYRDFLAHVHHG